MTGKQITALTEADMFTDGDLLLVRKTGQGTDQKITYSKFVASIGNSAVNGYVAISDNDNELTLTAANKLKVPAYSEGMKVSFISPITSDGTVTMKIGTLSQVPLEIFAHDETVILKQGEYVEAIYTNGKFKQTNRLNTDLIASNEYTAKIGDIIPGAHPRTILNLTSSTDVIKDHYYVGMSLLFTVPEHVKGLVFVKVDNLAEMPLTKNTNYYDFRNNSLVAGTAIMAIFDGHQFVQHVYTRIEEPEPLPEYTQEELEEIESQPDLTESDDPAAATSPTDTNSRGEKFFDIVIPVGNSESITTISAAVNNLRNTYGDDGGGKTCAIELQADYKNTNYEIIGNTSYSYEGTLNLDWISIFSKSPVGVKLQKGLKFHCHKSPILNAKFSVGISASNTDYLNNGSSVFMNYGPGQIILGKKFECTLNSNVTQAGFNGPLQTYMFYNSGYYPEETSLIAKHGFKFTTNLALGLNGFHSIDLNGGNLNGGNLNNNITLLQKVTPSTTNYNQSIHFQNDGNCLMTDTTISSDVSGESLFVTYSPTTLKNVVANIGTNCDGVSVKSYTSKNHLTMESCSFNHADQAEKDVVIDGTKDTRIYLKDTTVSTNQTIGTQTDKGLIQNIS